MQEEKEKALKHEKEEEREKESRLPPWKRGRDIGGFSCPAPHPVSLESPSEKPDESEAGEPQSAGKDARSSESVPQQSPTLATPLSPQSSSKKSRFLRDAPLTVPLPCSPTSVLKRPRTFSDSPMPQAPSIPLASKSGEPVQEDAVQAPQTSVLVAAPHELESKTPELAAQKHAPQEEEKMETSKDSEASKDTKHEMLKKIEDEKKRGRERVKKEVEKKERKSSSSSDSSSSDSDSGSSSSSRSSSSSSSSSEEEKSHPTSGGRRVSGSNVLARSLFKHFGDIPHEYCNH